MNRVFSKLTNFTSYYSTSNLIPIVVSAIFIFSCSDDDKQSPMTSIGIPKEIKSLISFSGDKDASTVLINTQGGPSTILDTINLDQALQDFDTSNILVVNVHQAQTLNPNLFEGNDITFDQAINFDIESTEILYRVIKYFKDDSRIVYVLGVSFGAFMVQELIAKKGINVADKYLIMVGRLDIDDIIWQGLSEGRFGYFENGINPILEDEIETDITERNMARLAAGLGMNRYTHLLNTFEDLSKITYVYGKKDQAVGRLTDAEVNFLHSKNANIISGNGDHDETINSFFAQGLNETFGIE
ncbi:hypothetical protein [Aquimarina aquimarini]|uniref:hypothetical protein n=1 Tax=Aquimarina aquimarini TaxID=1191734 RepID=UPI001F187014|nr:hypothetical protein [Aquimarina aquimarini]